MNTDTRQTFRAILTADLERLPRPTRQGRVQAERRAVQFGYPVGFHEETESWVYLRNDMAPHLLFAFYENFTPDDLICKVVEPGQELQPGEGASVQFNADRCLRGCT